MIKNISFTCLLFLVVLMISTCGFTTWDGNFSEIPDSNGDGTDSNGETTDPNGGDGTDPNGGDGTDPNGGDGTDPNGGGGTDPGGGGGTDPGGNGCEMITNANVYNILQDNNGNNFKLDGEYCLGENIDLTSLTGNWEPLATFTGIFDGRGHTISGLKIDDSTGSSVGFFRKLGENGNGATVKNLTFNQPNVTGVGETGALVGGSNAPTVIENVKIIGGTITGDSSNTAYGTGGLAGKNNGTIRNSYATSNVSGDPVGGLVGYNIYHGIENSYATGEVRGTYAGGLVGSNDQGTIRNSYATGNVIGGTNGIYIGGLVGYGSGAIKNSYATGSVSGGGSSNVGGLVGYHYGAGEITNSYFDKTATMQEDGIGKDFTNSQAGNVQGFAGAPVQNAFVDWDFSSIWKWIGNGVWPTLVWQ